jgi:hypothetical protein
MLVQYGLERPLRKMARRSFPIVVYRGPDSDLWLVLLWPNLSLDVDYQLSTHQLKNSMQLLGEVDLRPEPSGMLPELFAGDTVVVRTVVGSKLIVQ